MAQDSDTIKALLAAAQDSIIVYSSLLDPRYRPNDFHRYLSRQLQRIVAEGRGRLIIQAPPQHGKTSIISQKFIAWLMGKHPDWPIIAASYGDKLVEHNGGAIRSHLDNGLHQLIFPDSKLNPDSRAKADFRTLKEGHYLGVTIRGGGTGFAAKCLTADTLVATPDGSRRIDTLKVGDSVLSHAFKGALVEKPVLAVAKRYTDDFFKITTSTGHVVKATGDHPFFTGNGYTPARELALHNSLLRFSSLENVTKFVHIASIERIQRKTLVYDIQIQETANFFANGILVHNCFIIDDPIKNRAEAESPTFRAHLKDWYRSVVYPRLAEDSILVIMHTRWHDDDLAGWLVDEHKSEKWSVLNFPAIAEENDILGRAPGEALVPERFSKGALDAKRLAVGPREWESLYQGRPRPKGGSVFDREWLKFYSAKNVMAAVWAMNRYIVVDPARVKKETSDYTAMCVIGLHFDGNYYLLDAVYDRLSLRERAMTLLELHRKWRPLLTGYKKTGHEQDIEYLTESQERENYRFPVTPLTESNAKAGRIERLAPYFEDQKWWLPRTLWKTDSTGTARDLIDQFVQEEYAAFPAGRHDDFLDCLSGIYDMPTKWPRMRERIISSDSEILIV